MKKTVILLIVLLTYSSFAYSQDSEKSLPKRDTQKNDLNINVHPFTIIEGININYDRVINKDISIGLSVFKAFGNQDPIDDNKDIELMASADFVVSPHIKYYVGKRFARRFYLQGLTIISSGKLYSFSNNNPISEEEKNYTSVATGFGIGDKRILKNGIFIDFGIAMAYILTNKTNQEWLIHPSLSVGYRF